MSEEKGTKPTKKRVIITVPIDILEAMDEYCEKFGLNRSAFINLSVVDRLQKEGETIGFEKKGE